MSTSLFRAEAALQATQSSKPKVVLPPAEVPTMMAAPYRRQRYLTQLTNIARLSGYPEGGVPEITAISYWALEEIAKANVRTAAKSRVDIALDQEIEQLKGSVTDCTRQLREARQPTDRPVAEAMQRQIDRLQQLTESIRDLGQ